LPPGSEGMKDRFSGQDLRSPEGQHDPLSRINSLVSIIVSTRHNLTSMPTRMVKLKDLIVLVKGGGERVTGVAQRIQVRRQRKEEK